MPARDLVFRFLGVDAGAGREFDRISGKASKTQGLIGKFALGFAAAGATVAAVSVKMADEFDSADARMRQAFKNTGHSADEYNGRIALVSKRLENLGFSHAQTETGLANLTTALRSPTRAFKDIGLAADLARFKHIDLGSAATIVAKAEEGNLKVLKQLGIDLPVTTGGVAKLTAARTALSAAQEHLSQLEDLQHQKAHLTLADHFALENAQQRVAAAQKKVNDAASAGKVIHEQLAHILGGQAQAAAGTLAGKEQILRSKLTDLGVELGHKLIPALTSLVDYTNKHVVPALEGFGGWVSRNKRPIEDIAKVLAAIAAFRFASNKLTDIGKLFGLGGRGVGGVAGELGVQRVFVVNMPPGGIGGGGPVSTAERDAKNVGTGGVLAAAGRFLKSPLGGGALALTGATLTDTYHGNPLSGFYPQQFTRGINSLPASRRLAAAQDYLNVTGLTKPLGSLDALKKFQSNPAEMAAVDKWLQKWGLDINGVSLAAKQSANDIDNEKSSLARLRDEVVRHASAVATSIASIKKMPGAYAQLVAQARREGVSIGAALDAGITIGIVQNGGQVSIVSKKLVGDVLTTMHRRAELGSPSKITTQYGRWIAEGLAVGFTGESAKVLAQLSKATDKMLVSLGGQTQAAISKYQSDLAARTSFRQGLQQSLAGAGDIGGATVFGGNSGPQGGVRGYLTAEASGLRKLAVSLRKLAKMGLSPVLLAQIANAGPQQGVLLAQEILSGTDGSIRSLNRIESSIQTYANTAAGTVANAQFGRTLTHDLAAIATLAKSVEHLASKSGRWNHADMTTFASILARELSRILKIPLSDIDKALGVRSWAGS